MPLKIISLFMATDITSSLMMPKRSVPSIGCLPFGMASKSVLASHWNMASHCALFLV